MCSHSAIRSWHSRVIPYVSFVHTRWRLCLLDAMSQTRPVFRATWSASISTKDL